jgi:hypothetical protein
MLHKEEILFSKEECDKIISYMETGIDDIIPVDFAGKYNEVGGKMVSYNSVLENEKRWFIDKIIICVITCYCFTDSSIMEQESRLAT